MFIVLVTRVILALDLNLYIPLSKVTIILFSRRGLTLLLVLELWYFFLRHGISLRKRQPSEFVHKFAYVKIA